jgi:hypothetical protein
MPTRPPAVKRRGGLTGRKPLPYQAIRMTHLNAIAAANTARLWWRGYSHAARWRD